MPSTEKTDAIIFGAGPAGLAAALTLARAGKKALVIEKDKQVGGISKTLKYKDNYFDLGGHRFFTKSREVAELWEETLGKDFLTRPRLSRIYYGQKFFHYPINLWNAFAGLGFIASAQIIASFLKAQLASRKYERTFEQWVSNRFGKKLYGIFFKTYTEKVWGLPCGQIQAEWAAQRIKNLSLTSLLKNALLRQKNGQIRTLITQFKYPRYGPGMMYAKMAENVTEMGGKIILETGVKEIRHDGNGKVIGVAAKDKNGEEIFFQADHFISSLPISALIECLFPSAPPEVLAAAKNLRYRSFIAINLILNSPDIFPDNWIYVHAPEVKMGRVQNFKNWSPDMVADKNQTTLGLEYFCDEGDDFWKMPDARLIKLGLAELEKIGLGKSADFADGFVARVPKAYPIYDPAYAENMKIIREYSGAFKNLQTIGRCGMFKYNNMDHSILTGIYAAKNSLGEKHNIWNINTDQEYQEEK